MNEDYSLDLSLSRADLKDAEKKVLGLEIPKFATYVPDFEAIERAKEKYGAAKNLIIEGNGGSISSLRGFLSCFGDDADKNVYMLDTDDPDYIDSIRKKCKKEDTLFIVINRSGNSIQTISGYMALRDYDTVFITATGSTLYNIGKIQEIPLFDKTSEHPEFAGRFSGITEFGLIPAAILGIDAKGIFEGAKKMYTECAPGIPFSENPALKTALHLDKLEKMRYDEIFLSIYSKKVAGFFELFVQLIHESVCKDGKGQTIYGGDAPENQHHTLQRFNSGMKDSVGFFLTIDKFHSDFELSVPEDIKDIQCRNIKLGQFEKLTMADIIHTEFEGTWKDAAEMEMPIINLKLREVSPYTAGMLVAFMQYVAFYSAILRNVNPFDQPGVERSKEYIFKLVEEK
jgi:glucose-6-phosphate isomerase